MFAFGFLVVLFCSLLMFISISSFLIIYGDAGCGNGGNGQGSMVGSVEETMNKT